MSKRERERTSYYITLERFKRLMFDRANARIMTTIVPNFHLAHAYGES